MTEDVCLISQLGSHLLRGTLSLPGKDDSWEYELVKTVKLGVEALQGTK